MNTEGNLRAKLYNFEIASWSELEANQREPIFISKSEADYAERIQDFFFNQFSYYSLKWTQKSSSKDNNDLLEAETSWKTYFKSIFLESKDSYELIYDGFGNQGSKVFQMLLGLELTYPINQLTIKKDSILNQKGKDSYVAEVNAKNQSKIRIELANELINVNKQIDIFNQNYMLNFNIGNLSEKEKILKKEYKDEWEKQNIHEKKILELTDKLNKIEKEGISKSSDIIKATKEGEKSQKRILELKEYLEIGIFFSNLDIKHCPSCNHTIEETKKKAKLSQHQCALCDESITNIENISDSQDFAEKVINLENQNSELKTLVKRLEDDNVVLRKEYQGIKTLINSCEQQKTTFKNLKNILNELKALEDSIKIELKRTSPDLTEKDSLTAKKAVLEYQISEIDKKTTNTSIVKYDNKILFLNAALNKLNKMRFDLGTTILSRLQTIMLNEIQEFGLNSITEVSISEKLDVIYKQNDTLITFKEISEGEQLRAKLAFYLSLIQLDIEFNVGRHTRFLMIDSPNKEEGDAKYLEGLSNVLRNIQTRFKNQLQILIGTAERGFESVLDNQYVSPEGTFVF